MLNIDDTGQAHALRRIARQIQEIADRVEQPDFSNGTEDLLLDCQEWRGQGTLHREITRPSLRSTRLALPDPRLVRKIIRQRQLRSRFFNQELLGDPVWDMLLDLAAARAEHRRVSVTSLCIASGVPPTTALRWIKVLMESDLLERCDDDTDRRRAFISLSDKGAELMAAYFHLLGSDATRLV